MLFNATLMGLLLVVLAWIFVVEFLEIVWVLLSVGLIKKIVFFFFVFHAEFVGVMMTIEIVHSNIG
jgi:hypothetical protein